MTPIEVSASLERHSGNYAGEAKTECLVLCSDLSALHNYRITKHHVDPPRIETRPPSVNNRLSILRNSERHSSSGLNRRSVCCQKPSLSIPNQTSPNFINKAFVKSHQPHLVKVSVYTKAVNPYIVIFDSNKKYSKPAVYLKLVNCVVKPGGHENKDMKTNNDSEDGLLFRIFPCKHEDVDSTSIITLRTSTIEKRDEWVAFLKAVTDGKASPQSKTGYIPGSSVLPTLVEHEDNLIEEEENSSDCLTSPSRKNMREGRRSSLNSLGVRLRCYAVGKDRV